MTNTDAIERLLFRRIMENRLVGYTMETAQEIAALLEQEAEAVEVKNVDLSIDDGSVIMRWKDDGKNWSLTAICPHVAMYDGINPAYYVSTMTGESVKEAKVGEPEPYYVDFAALESAYSEGWHDADEAYYENFEDAWLKSDTRNTPLAAPVAATTREDVVSARAKAVKFISEHDPFGDVFSQHELQLLECNK